MATRRSPPSSADSSTPVMIGRLSSVDAAGVTWRSAWASSAPGTCTGSPVGQGELRVLVGGGDAEARSRRGRR